MGHLVRTLRCIRIGAEVIVRAVVAAALIAGVARTAIEAIAHLSERIAHTSVQLAVAELEWLFISFAQHISTLIVSILRHILIAVLHVYGEGICKVTLEAVYLFAQVPREGLLLASLIVAEEFGTLCLCAALIFLSILAQKIVIHDRFRAATQ